MRIEKFEEIEAWQEGRALIGEVYWITGSSKFDADRNPRDQLRRAAVSIVANIAEGFERGSKRQLAQARGSAGEVRSLLHVAHDLGYIPNEAFESLMEQAVKVTRLITGFIRYLSGES